MVTSVTTQRILRVVYSISKVKLFSGFINDGQGNTDIKKPSVTERELCRNLEIFSELNRAVNTDISFPSHNITLFSSHTFSSSFLNNVWVYCPDC